MHCTHAAAHRGSLWAWPRVLALVGPSGSGKDTIAQALGRYGYRPVALAQPLLHFLHTVWPEGYPRRRAQALGAWCAAEDAQALVRVAWGTMRAQPDQRWVISDVRRQAELLALRDAPGPYFAAIYVAADQAVRRQRLTRRQRADGLQETGTPDEVAAESAVAGLHPLCDATWDNTAEHVDPIGHWVRVIAAWNPWEQPFPRAWLSRPPAAAPECQCTVEASSHV